MIGKRTRTAALIMAAAVAVVSCSSSDDAASITGEDLSSRPGVASEVSAPAASSTEAPTTSVAPEPPDAEPVVTEPAPPSTEATATTVADEPASTEPTVAGTDEELAVIDAIAFFEEQWKTCVSAVPSCDFNVVGARRQVNEANLAVSEAVRFNNNDYRISNIDQLDYRVDGVTVADDGTTAQAAVCVTDPIVVTEADGTVVDDRFLSSIQLWDLVLAGDVWTLGARNIVGEIAEGPEANVCT